MPTQINSNYSANFQKFVDFANKAYDTKGVKGADTVVRFEGAPAGDYKGTFASFLRTSEMKTANDRVRDLFLKTVADMFGGEKFIPDLVRDNMKLEDFGKGKPLTARRIKLVATAVNMLGGGKFMDSASVGKATSMGYVASELPKLARTAHLYQQATGCTDAEAEAAALNPNSKARRLFDCGGRFTLNAENFKKGLALMDKFAGWFDNLHDDYEAGKFDTPTKRNFMAGVCNRKSAVSALKFLMEEIAVNSKIPLDAENPEDVFGMRNNPAMRFIGRNYTISFANSLAQIPPEKRTVLYAVFDAYHKLPAGNQMPEKDSEIAQSAILGARVMRHFDAVVALQSAGKLDRAHLTPLLYSELQVSTNATNKEITEALEAKLQSDENIEIIMPLHTLAMQSGATLDEAAAAIRSGTGIKNAPGISSANGQLEALDGTARGGRETMIGDLYRPAQPSLIKDDSPAIPMENSKFVFNFPDGVTVAAKKGAAEDKEVSDSCNAIADKIKDLCGEVHTAQLSNIYYALSQSGTGCNTKRAFEQYGISSDEHMPLTFTLSRNDETGAVTIKYSEPEGFPLKFNWTTTVDVDGKSTSSPMRIDHGQYEAEAMTHAGSLAAKLPGNDRTAAEAVIRDALAHCGDDFDLKGLVSKYIPGLCVNGAGELRTPDQIKARIDALRANLAEIRASSNGNLAAEKAGVNFLDTLGAQSVPPGMIGRIVQASLSAKPGEYAKLSPSSTPQQLFQAVVDMHKAVEKVLRDVHFTETFTESPELLAGRDYIASLVFTRFPPAKLQAAASAFRGETALKVLALVNKIMAGDYPPKTGPLTEDQRYAIDMQCSSLGLFFGQFNLAAETVLGVDGGEYRAFKGPIDKNALGHKDIFRGILALADAQIAAQAEEARQNENINAAFEPAKTHAANAYSKAGEGNAEKVDELINAALVRCAANTDALNVLSNNMNKILVSNTATLRSIEDVRERAEAIAENFRELKVLSKDNPAIYEAGKRLMAGMEGKALPPGMIGRLVLAATNAKIAAARKLSSRSSGFDIHRAVTEFRDNLMRAMTASGAEEATDGPNEKQACRNFFGEVMMGRCGANTLRAMQGAFAGDTPGKMLAFYEDISHGHHNEGLGHEITAKFENEADSHMMNLANLKGAIDVALDGHFGADVVPYNGSFIANEIGGEEILDDLANLASRQQG